MVAHLTDLDAGELVISFGDVHLYNNHINQAKKQLSRNVLPLPTLTINRLVKDIDDFKYEDFVIDEYEAHSSIAAPVAV